MSRASILVLLGTLPGLVPLLPAKPAARTTHAPANKTDPKARAKMGAKTVSTNHPKGKVVGTRLVKTKSGRVVRVAVHAPAGPTFQTHPEPDRYAEIQKALSDRGYYKGETLGEWNEDSAVALRRFQAEANLPDDGKITALTLTGLGLGPRHDGSTASTVPLVPGSAVPSVVGSTVGPAASLPAAPVPAPPPPIASQPPAR